MENSDRGVPDVIFESGWLLESSIEEITGEVTNEDALTEIEIRLPEFQESWNKFGNRLLQAVTSHFEIGFKERDIKGFFLYGKLHSQSHPLLINVKRFLKSTHPTPDSMSEFNEIVFHELLHILLQDCLKSWPTPVIERFGSEPFEVQAHLHLMALQKFAHSKVGNDPKPLGNWYEKIGANYSRAWDIINDEKTYINLLTEISTCFAMPKRQ